jgi:hypothetical protein
MLNNPRQCASSCQLNPRKVMSDEIDGWIQRQRWGCGKTKCMFYTTYATIFLIMNFFTLLTFRTESNDALTHLRFTLHFYQICIVEVFPGCKSLIYVPRHVVPTSSKLGGEKWLESYGSVLPWLGYLLAASIRFLLPRGTTGCWSNLIMKWTAAFRSNVQF